MTGAATGPAGLRIAQVVTRRQLRGAEVFAGQLAERLAARGHTVTLAGLYAPGEPPLAASGVDLADLGGSRGRVLSPGLLGAAIAFLRAWRPDLIQANGSDTLKYLVLARRLAGLRVPLVYRNISIASAWVRGPVHRAWNRWLARRVDAVAAVSPAAARDYARVYGLAPQRIEVLPLGTPVPDRVDREEARRRLAEIVGRGGRGAAAGGAFPGPVLLHAGSFTPEKDQASLLRAFARTAERHPDAVLVLAGDGPLRERTKALAGSLGLGDRTFFPGARSDLADWMAGADLLVLSSRIEGLPGVVLEAAARRLPVVATAVGSVPDAVVDGRTGLLVPPGDPEALGQALDRLLANGDLRRDLGAAGRDHVRRHFELDGVVERFERLYGRLVGESRG